MAALIMPDKTDEKVICQSECGHTDCALWRAVFAMKCRICKEEIEAGRAYHEKRVNGKTVSIVHEVCELEQDEALSKLERAPKEVTDMLDDAISK